MVKTKDEELTHLRTEVGGMKDQIVKVFEENVDIKRKVRLTSGCSLMGGKFSVDDKRAKNQVSAARVFPLANKLIIGVFRDAVESVSLVTLIWKCFSYFERIGAQSAAIDRHVHRQIRRAHDHCNELKHGFRQGAQRHDKGEEQFDAHICMEKLSDERSAYKAARRSVSLQIAA